MLSPPLPSYQEYKEAFLKKGVVYPLEAVPFLREGLLAKLPVSKDKTGWPWTDEVDPKTYSDDISWPKISIISPSFNQGQYFEETIRSVLLQNYPNLEYIVMDGGSSDNTRSVLNEYASWISYWQSEKDRGQSHALNMGFSLADGEIYGWINSDDFYNKGTLKTIAMAFIADKGQFIYGNSLNLTNGILEPYYSAVLFDRYLYIPGLAQPSVFWHKSIHQPLWEDLNCTLDFELWMRIARGAKKKYINKFLSVSRIHQESKTHSIDPASKNKWQEDHERQWKVHGPVLNWERLNLENRVLQKVLNVFPFLKSLF